MGNGTRILLNADGIITDWAKQHFEPVSSPLSAIANPKVAFDLLTRWIIRVMVFLCSRVCRN